MIVHDNVPHNVVEVVLSELQDQDRSVGPRS
jgi:hypothetical protein